MKVFKRMMDKHDRENDDCIVRQLEMCVDNTIITPGYSIQFWRDVALYGVEEAILYLRNGKHGNADVLAKEWEEIKKRINSNENSSK